MKKFILGFILGATIFGIGVAFAAAAVLYDGRNQPVGTSTNPLFVQGV